MNRNKQLETPLPVLLRRSLELTHKDAHVSRQLEAAQLRNGVTLRLSLKALVEPADGAEWEAYHKTLGSGQVVCPECEISGGEPQGCQLCNGVGMVSRPRWDEWYLESRDCKDYQLGCEATCERASCVRDIARISQGALVLMLRAATSSKAAMKDRGNSAEGFETEDLCDNPQALRRFLNMLAVSCGCITSDGFADKDEEEE